jgi:hypothetical protein
LNQSQKYTLRAFTDTAISTSITQCNISKP